MITPVAFFHRFFLIVRKNAPGYNAPIMRPGLLLRVRKCRNYINTSS